MKKICIVVPYFGSWPKWFNIFLESCRYNPNITWLLYTDCGTPDNLPDNVHIENADLTMFNTLASQKLNMDIRITDKFRYKLCDMKPAYGTIFEDYLTGYDFWGYGDIDLIFGNIQDFITDDMLENYDVINVKKEYIVAHFILYRNEKRITELYKKGPYDQVFLDVETCYCFDESNFVFDRSIYDKTPFAERFSFSLKKLINRLSGRQRLTILPKVKSMTHILYEAVKEKAIRLYSETLFETEITACRINMLGRFDATIDHECEYLWNKGTLTNNKTGKPLLYFHFQYFKNNDRFVVPAWKTVPDAFTISADGFKAH